MFFKLEICEFSLITLGDLIDVQGFCIYIEIDCLALGHRDRRRAFVRCARQVACSSTTGFNSCFHPIGKAMNIPLEKIEGRKFCVVFVKTVDEARGKVQLQCMRGRASVDRGKVSVIDIILIIVLRGENMRAYYLKGLETTIEDFEYICTKFEEKGIYLTLLEYDYSKFFKLSTDEIVESLKSRISMDQDISLICHSAGCNFGLLLANSLPNVKNVAFISPLFDEVTKAEKKAVTLSKNETSYKTTPSKFGIKKLKNIFVFLKSKKWVPIELSRYIHSDINTIILYSKGDRYISRSILYSMAKLDNIDIAELDCNSHNPVLEETPCIELIRESFNKNSKRLS